MADSTTPTTSWWRPAAQDRHPLKGPVAPPLCPSRGHRPASTGHHHSAARAAEPTICVRADPVLGPLDPVLDGAAVAPVLGAERCVPRHVRYRPGRELRVLYELDAGLAHLTVLRPDRTQRLWSRVQASGLLERAPDGARPVPELGGVLQRYPVDLRLPGLLEVARSDETAGSNRAGPGSPAGAGMELVRYKPGRRALLRGRGEYAKVRADDAGARTVALARELIRRGIATPTPLHHDAALRMTVHAEVPGTRLADLRGPALEAWMEPVAEALARLHATRIPGLPPHSMHDEVADLQAAATTAAALRPQRADAIARLTCALVACLQHGHGTATIHGSFHQDQVLVGDDGVILLDLDSAAAGDPLLDVGHFAAYLSAAGELTARDRFLAACDTPAPIHEAAALLRWSSLPFRTLEPGWPEAIDRRLDLAAVRLRRSGG
jgi:Phosphotransferase enzyme family